MKIIITLIAIVSCSPNRTDITGNEEISLADPLPSWNDGKTKTAIIDFVEDVTDPSNIDFIKVSDRIATFDNDGNLWSEQPMYFQLIFAIDRVREMAANHPEQKEQQPFKAVLQDDMKLVLASGEKGLVEQVMATHAGITTDEFNRIVREWLSTSNHLRYNKPYNKLIY